MHSVLNGKHLPKRSIVRKIEAKDGFTPRTQPTKNKQRKGELKKKLIENSYKYVGQCREQKYSVEIFSFRRIAFKR